MTADTFAWIIIGIATIVNVFLLAKEIRVERKENKRYEE